MEQKAILTKIANIQHLGLGIKKDVVGKNYKYAKKENILNLLTPYFKREGLIYTYKVIHIEKVDNIIIYKMVLTISDIESTQSIEYSDFIVMDLNIKVMSLGQQRGACDTYLWKYMLPNIFNILVSDKDLDDFANEQLQNETISDKVEKKEAVKNNSDEYNTIINFFKNKDNKDTFKLNDVKKIIKTFDGYTLIEKLENLLQNEPKTKMVMELINGKT